MPRRRLSPRTLKVSLVLSPRTQMTGLEDLDARIAYLMVPHFTEVERV